MTDRFVTVPDTLELPAAVKVPSARLSDSGTAGRAALAAIDAAALRAVAGLGTASTTAASDYATAGQGTKADSAAQLAGDLGGTATAPTVTGGTHHGHTASQVSGLGTAATAAALDFQAAIDRGQLAASALRLRTASVTVGIAGDSTGTGPKWIDTWATAAGVADTALRVEILHWNTGTGAYDAATVVQPGGVDLTTTVHDTFTRTAADLYGTTPDIGGVTWGGDAPSAAGDYSINGTSAVATSDGVGSIMLINQVLAGDVTMTITGTLSTVPAASAAHNKNWYLCHQSGAAYLFARLSVSGAGATTWTLFKRVAGVTTSLGSVATPLPANAAGQSYTLTFSRIGTTVTATINGNTATGSLLTEDLAALGTNAGFQTGLPGDTVGDFRLQVSDSSRTLRLYNASVSGSILTTQQSALGTMYPVPLDLLFINDGHNYAGVSPAQFEAAIDSFLAAFRAAQPSAGIVISSQNPQVPPATGYAGHAARQAVLRSFCARRGLGYLPVIEAFYVQPDRGAALISSDGVHPTTGAGSGSELWAGVATTYMAAI